MSSSFDKLYKAFEDQFRGAPELIVRRLEVYVPLLAKVAEKVDGTPVAIDIGCGRGEWMHVATAAGFKAVGVDLNEGMASEARQRGFNIVVRDALEFLRGVESSSVDVVTAFHVVEHLEVEYVLEILQQCHRILSSGGLLIMETPNPENLSVSTATFYLDPTHQRPMPPALLEFMIRQSGFDSAGILRLNGELVTTDVATFEQTMHVMFNSGPDYACLALRDSNSYAEDILVPFIHGATQPIPADTQKLAQSAKAADPQQSEQAGLASAAEQPEHVVQEMAFRDAEIARLHHHIAATEAANAEQRGSLTERADALERSKQAVEQELEGLRGTAVELANTGASLRETRVRLAQIETEAAQLRDQIAAKDIAHAEERGSLTSRVDALELDIGAREQELEVLRNAQAELKSASASLQRARHRVKQGRAEIDQLRRQFASGEAEHAGRQAGLTERLAAAQKRIRQLSRQNDDLHSQVDDLSRRLGDENALRLAVSQSDERAGAATRAVGLLQKDIEGQSLAQTHRVAELQAAIQQLVANSDELRHQNAHLAHMLGTLTAPGIVKRSLNATGQRVSRVVGAPRGTIRFFGAHALAWLRMRPRAMALARRTLQRTPMLERQLLSFAAARPRSALNFSSQWALEPDPDALREWRRLFGLRDE